MTRITDGPGPGTSGSLPRTRKGCGGTGGSGNGLNLVSSWKKLPVSLTVANDDGGVTEDLQDSVRHSDRSLDLGSVHVDRLTTPSRERSRHPQFLSFRDTNIEGRTSYPGWRGTLRVLPPRV